MQPTRLAVLLGVAAAAFAGPVYHVTLTEPSVINGTTLKPGDYRIEVNNDTATIREGRHVVEAPVKVENSPTKFDSTAVLYHPVEGTQSAPVKNGEVPMQIESIRIGGTHTNLNFEK
jgi:hypothetical protein